MQSGSKAAKRAAVVNKERCVACGACKKECPREAISILYGCFAEIAAQRCVGCGKCAKICPAGCIDVSIV